MKFHSTNPLVANTFGGLMGGDAGVDFPGRGGLSEGMTIADIARKHGVPIALIEQQVAKGIKVEMEHTNNPTIARIISMDHLVEIPNYYDWLEAMEQSAKQQMGQYSG